MLLEILKKTSAAIILIMIFFNTSNGVCGQWAMPESTIYISTEYREGIHPGLGNKVQWQITPGTCHDGDSLDFILEGKQKFCSLCLDKKETGNFIQLLDAKGKVIDSSYGSFIPSLGFPAPCRIIDFSFLNLEGAFKIRRSAGGRKFSTTYSFHIDSVTLEEAIENEWVDPGFDLGGDSSDLVVMVVENMDKQVLFKQLWQKHGTWWLYEETFTGKSWRR